GQGGPLGSDQSPSVAARCQLEAPVRLGRVVDGHQGRDEQRRVDAPSGLLILVRLEAVAARQLEVDLVLEEDGRLAEEGVDAAEELVPVEERLESRVVRIEVLDAVHQPPPRLAEALLAVDHPDAGLLRPGLNLLGGTSELGDLTGAEEAAADEEAVASIVRQ